MTEEDRQLLRDYIMACNQFADAVGRMTDVIGAQAQAIDELAGAVHQTLEVLLMEQGEDAPTNYLDGSPT